MVQWTPDVDAKMLMHILRIHAVKIDYQELARAMGPDVTPKALMHRIQKLKKDAEGPASGASASQPSSPKVVKSPAKAPVKKGTKATEAAGGADRPTDVMITDLPDVTTSARGTKRSLTKGVNDDTTLADNKEASSEAVQPVVKKAKSGGRAKKAAAENIDVGDLGFGEPLPSKAKKGRAAKKNSTDEVNADGAEVTQPVAKKATRKPRAAKKAASTIAVDANDVEAANPAPKKAARKPRASKKATKTEEADVVKKEVNPENIDTVDDDASTSHFDDAMQQVTYDGMEDDGLDADGLDANDRAILALGDHMSVNESAFNTNQSVPFLPADMYENRMDFEGV